MVAGDGLDVEPCGSDEERAVWTPLFRQKPRKNGHRDLGEGC